MEERKSGSLKHFGKSGRWFVFTFFKWNSWGADQEAIQEAARMGVLPSPIPQKAWQSRNLKDPTLSLSAVAVTRQASWQKPWKPASFPLEKLTRLLHAHKPSKLASLGRKTFLWKSSSKLTYLASWYLALPFLTFRNMNLRWAYLHWRNTAGTFFLACEEFSLCVETTWVKYLEWNPGSIEVNGKTPIHFSGAGISLFTVLKLELLIDC